MATHPGRRLVSINTNVGGNLYRVVRGVTAECTIRMAPDPETEMDGPYVRLAVNPDGSWLVTTRDGPGDDEVIAASGRLPNPAGG